MSGAQAAPYPVSRGVAVLFYLPGESRFRKVCLPLEEQLRACGYDTHVFHANSLLADTLRVLEGASAASSFVLVYNGHGAMHQGQQLLWTQAGYVRVDELEDAIDRGTRKGTPKLIVTDCCYGAVDAGPGVPPVWTWPPGDESTIHDMAVLHATCPGHYSHSNSTSSLTVFFARALAANPGGVTLDQVFYSLADAMRAMDHGVMQPTLDNRLSRPLLFCATAAAGPGCQATPAPAAPPAFPVIHLASGMVLDVHGGSFANGAALELFPPHGGDNQQFSFQPGKGWGVLCATASGLVADVTGDGREPGTRLLMFPQHGGDNQLFKFEPAKGKRGYGLLRAKASGLVLAAQSSQPGSALVLAEETGQEDQLFHVG